MLLCADAEKLNPICKLYWAERGQEPSNSFFLPSSWESLIALLQAGAQKRVGRNDIFRIVSGDRGLYYDWLNLTASLGGFDLIQSEGRLTQEVALDRQETIEATKRFVELARLCGISPTMDAQIEAFARKELAMYVGWTDSFRFHRANGALSEVSVTPLKKSAGAEQSTPPFRDIRLGHSPRDMRHARKSLVDGWLMVFPKKADDKHVHRALASATMFLDPENQRRLLREGFPSPSAWAIEREIEVLHADRTAASNMGVFGSDKHQGTSGMIAQHRVEQSFEVFLETMKLAIYSGRWIASPRTNVDKVIARALKELINDDRDVDRVMKDLATYIRGKMHNLA